RHKTARGNRFGAHGGTADASACGAAPRQYVVHEFVIHGLVTFADCQHKILVGNRSRRGPPEQFNAVRPCRKGTGLSRCTAETARNQEDKMLQPSSAKQLRFGKTTKWATSLL